MSETRERDNSEPERAVCFDWRDYAGPVRRVITASIDFVTVVLLFLVVLGGIWYVWFLRHPQDDLPPAPVWAALAAVYLYLTLLKRSRIRTLGYILTGVRIVDIRGGRPSMLQMTVRIAPVPLSFVPLFAALLFDLGWMVDEPRTQALRDKWAATFVLRRHAKPIGTAPIRYMRIGYSGIFLIFPEVGQVERFSQPSPQRSLGPL